MDWFVYHLVGDVLTHYWYMVQCTIFGYVKNKNKKALLLVPYCKLMIFQIRMSYYVQMGRTLHLWHPPTT